MTIIFAGLLAMHAKACYMLFCLRDNVAAHYCRSHVIRPQTEIGYSSMDIDRLSFYVVDCVNSQVQSPIFPQCPRIYRLSSRFIN